MDRSWDRRLFQGFGYNEILKERFTNQIVNRSFLFYL